MAYDDDDKFRKNEDGRIKGQPHPDAQKNLEYTFSELKGLTTNNSLEIIFYDCDDKDIVKDPKYVCFYWKDERGIRFGNNISFHQDYNKFRDALNKIIESCLKTRLLSKGSAACGAFR